MVSNLWLYKTKITKKIKIKMFVNPKLAVRSDLNMEFHLVAISVPHIFEEGCDFNYSFSGLSMKKAILLCSV